MIVADRMVIDREFDARVEQSRFSRQEWGLIMTATEFTIERPGDPDRSRLLADTSNVPAVLPVPDELEGGQRAGRGTGSAGSWGLLDALRGVLGGGSDGPEQAELDAAADLAQAYADELQARLEEQGRWEPVREAAEGE